MKVSFLIAALLFSLNLASQTIAGKDVSLVGKQISLCTYADFITYTELKLAETTVSADGSFTLKASLKTAQYCFVRCGYFYADFFCEPNKIYSVKWPNFSKSTNEARPYAEKIVKSLIIADADTLALNNSIVRFNEFYDKFLERNGPNLLVRSRAVGVVKQLRKAAYTQIGNITNPQFRNYVDYNIAIVDQLATMNQNYIYSGYLKSKPAKPFDLMYMEFFHQFYEKRLEALLFSNKDIGLLKILNKGISWVAFDKELAAKPFFEKDTLRQMATIKSFRGLYYEKEVKKESIIALLSIISKESELEFIRAAAINLISQLQFLAIGTKAPNYSLIDSQGSLFSLDKLTGGFVYLEITDPSCAACLLETKAIAAYRKKYSEKIRFVTVLINTSPQKAAEFKKSNKLDWEVLTVSPRDSPEFSEKFGIVAVPQYFIMNQDWRLFRSPALKPSQNIEKDFSEIKFRW